MEPSSRREARERLRCLSAFRSELQELEREKVLLLSPEQRAAVAAHHESLRSRLGTRFGADLLQDETRLSLGMRLAALLGGAAFFAALALFFHRIWGFLPSFAHGALLFAFPLVLLVAAEGAHCRRVHRYYTSLCAAAACVA